MAPIEAFFKSDNEITATVTDSGGSAVTGATVTLTLEDPSGSEVVSSQSMSDDGGGDYTYTVADDTMTEKNAIYVAKITAQSGGNQRYAEVDLYNTPDTD